MPPGSCTTGALAALAVAAAACGAAVGAGESPSVAARYVNDEAYRRAELESSLVNPANEYSARRLAHYAGGDRTWCALPEWNPRVEAVTLDDVDQGTAARATLSSRAEALDVRGAVDDEGVMRALGAAAFFRYPVQLAPYAASALVSRGAADRYGLAIDLARGTVGGLVRAEMADGSAALALTCASCHTAPGPDGLVVGVGSDRLDLGAMIADAAAGAREAWRAWGRGRVDVTTSDGIAPQRIPDLRPVRWLTYLHQEATLVRRSRATLAIRLETLIITSHDEALRPPRAVAWALATYLDSLADDLPPLEVPADGPVARGAQLFAARCAGCHAGEGMTGTPVPLAVVGTDPAVGSGADRGTGLYRVPSLRGVGTRGLLLHDASLPSLAAMFDPGRMRADFAGGTRPGPVPGHGFGLDLSADDRAALLAYLGAR